MIASSAAIFPTSASTPRLGNGLPPRAGALPRTQSQAVLQRKHTSVIAHAEGLRQRALRNTARTGVMCELCGLAMKSLEALERHRKTSPYHLRQVQRLSLASKTIEEAEVANFEETDDDEDGLGGRAKFLATFPMFTKGKKVFEHLETIYRQYEVRKDPTTDDLWITIERVATERIQFPAIVVNMKDLEDAVTNSDLPQTHSEFALRPDQRLKAQVEDKQRRSIVKFLQKRVKVLPTDDGLQPALFNFAAFELVPLPIEEVRERSPKGLRRLSTHFDALEGQLVHHGNKRYYVDKNLGRGAASSAFLVHDRQRRSFVLKRACGHESEDADEVRIAIKRSLNEATLACGMDDAHITKLLQVYSNKAPLCDTVWQHASGETLQKLIKGDGRACSGPLYDLGYDEVKPMLLGICFQIALALEYLHSCHIVHNDITPANILVNMDTRMVKLVALDLAVRGEMQDGRLVGALPIQLNRMYYCSPELVDAQSFDVESVDIYSDSSRLVTDDIVPVCSTDMWAWMKIVAELFEGQPLSNTVNLRGRLETLSHGHEGAEDWTVNQVVEWAKLKLKMPDRDVETFIRRGKVDGKKLVRITTANFERFITELPNGNTGNEMKKTIWTILAKEIHRRSIPDPLLNVLYQICEEDPSARPFDFTWIVQSGFPEDMRRMMAHPKNPMEEDIVIDEQEFLGVRLELGRACMNFGMDSEAVRLFKSILADTEKSEFNDKRATALYLLAHLKVQDEGNLEEAVNLLEEYVAKMGRDNATSTTLQKAREKLKRYRQKHYMRKLAAHKEFTP